MTLTNIKKGFIVLIVIALSVLIINCISIYRDYSIVNNNHFEYRWSMMQHPFYSGGDEISFFMKESDLDLKLWANSLTGKVSVKIISTNNITVYDEEFSQIDEHISLHLSPGEYNLTLQIESYTGGLFVGFNNAYKIESLPNERYEIIKGSSEKGFSWDYILYTPNEIKNNTLLVIPNNTGTVDDDIIVHKQNAIRLIKWKSELADSLGVPLLVPIFPRPESQADVYTHSLDRNTILLPKDERIDLQLIAMIEDCKNLFSKKDIALDKKIIMSGFSAAGDFTDRFSFLYPELVKATSLGGCDNMVPIKTLNGENLPYPIGTYDYKSITGKDFDINKFAEIKRFIYKGSKDEGGWWTIEDNGVETTYTGLEYYQQVTSKEITKASESSGSPIYVSGELNELMRDVILFRVYDKKILLERFKEITALFADRNLTNHIFKVYKNVDHDITNEIERDELEFFKNVLN